MVVKIESKNGKKAIYLEGALRVFSGINQNRAYIRANDRHFEFDTKILSFAEGESVDLDNYILSGKKATTEHGARKARKAKSAYNVNDYLSEAEQKALAEVEQKIDATKTTLANLEQSAREFYAIAAAKFDAEQQQLKAQREAEQAAKAEQQKQKDLAKFQALAQKLGIKIA